MTSPAFCIYDGSNFNINYLVARDRDVVLGRETSKTLNPKIYPKYNTETDRYSRLASWVIDELTWCHRPKNIVIENYAYAATGRVFNIGENTGILKYRLMKKEIPYHVVAPTTVKSTTVGKGNASKEDIIENFNRTFDTDIHEVLDTKTLNPVSDIADSYHICTYGIQQSILENYNT